jgi:Caspase domain/Thioredoxin
MIVRLVLLAAALLTLMQPAHARRVALVVGQGAYLGGAEATIGLSPLVNPPNDAGRIAELLERHGFEVLSCDGKRPGCFDLDRAGLLAALDQLHVGAKGADMALVFFAGHGLSTEEGNVLAPVDAKVDCATGAVRQGVTVERFMRATEPATHKLLILDACRDNPLGLVCPGLNNKKLSFTRIEAEAMQGLLLVTSTQFGQQALDGPPGSHSPFATALLAALEANANVFFEQVMNEVAHTTFEAARKQDGFLQIPGKVVGGVAPPDCLAGQGCIGDSRMAALAIENERLSAAAVEARTEAQRQASQAAKHRELARIQRLLLSPGPIAEIRMGSDDAPIMMIEYCVMWAGPCYAHHRNTMPLLKKKYIDTGNVLYIYRDFQIPIWVSKLT